MAADLELAGAVRSALTGVKAVTEVKMFGGIGFMLQGNLLVGASKRGLLVRVGKERQSQALAKPGARPMEMRGRLMEGYVYVDSPIAPGTVREWVEMARAFVGTLPLRGRRSSERPSKRQRAESIAHAVAIAFGRAKRRGLLAHFHRHGRVEIQDIVALFVDAGLTPTRKGPLGMNRRAYSIVVATVTGVSRWF